LYCYIIRLFSLTFFGLEVWGSAPLISMNKILVLQKMALRAITFNNRMASSSPLFYSLGILDVFKLYKLLVTILIFKLIYKHLPHSLLEY